QAFERAARVLETKDGDAHLGERCVLVRAQCVRTFERDAPAAAELLCSETFEHARARCRAETLPKGVARRPRRERCDRIGQGEAVGGAQNDLLAVLEYFANG